MLPGNERPEVEAGGKIIMPSSALDTLTRLHIVYRMQFKLSNEKDHALRSSRVCGGRGKDLYTKLDDVEPDAGRGRADPGRVQNSPHRHGCQVPASVRRFPRAHQPKGSARDKAQTLRLPLRRGHNSRQLQ